MFDREWSKLIDGQIFKLIYIIIPFIPVHIIKIYYIKTIWEKIIINFLYSIFHNNNIILLITRSSDHLF